MKCRSLAQGLGKGNNSGLERSPGEGVTDGSFSGETGRLVPSSQSSDFTAGKKAWGSWRWLPVQAGAGCKTAETGRFPGGGRPLRLVSMTTPGRQHCGFLPRGSRLLPEVTRSPAELGRGAEVPSLLPPPGASRECTRLWKTKVLS